MDEHSDDSKDLELEQIIARFLRQEEAGQHPNRNELLAEHPQIADSLRVFFADHDRMRKAANVQPPENQLEEPTLPPGSSLEEPTLQPGDALPTEEATMPPAGSTAPQPPEVGTTLRYFGDYELLEEIARGGMGVVYKARQTSLNRIVALKMILAGQLAGEEDVKRFHAEAEAAAQLDHPGIVPIYEVGAHDGQHYFSMGYVNGGSLADRLKNGPLPPREAAEFVKKISEAIAYAHERGVIHRDLKPGNVLLDDKGEPKVTDFGLAKRVEADSGLTATGQILGTPSYMPPEQATGNTDNVTESADVYALGAVLYALLTGHPPFQADNPIDTLMLVLEKQPTSPLQRNSAVSKDLETITLKCLEKAAKDRYSTSAELGAELERFLNGEPIQARPISSPVRIWRWCKRKPVISSLAVGLAVSLVMGVAVSLNYAMKSKELAQVNQSTSTRAATAELHELQERANADYRKVQILRTSQEAQRQKKAFELLKSISERRSEAEQMLGSLGDNQEQARRQNTEFWSRLDPQLGSEAYHWLTSASIQRFQTIDITSDYTAQPNRGTQNALLTSLVSVDKTSALIAYLQPTSQSNDFTEIKLADRQTAEAIRSIQVPRPKAMRWFDVINFAFSSDGQHLLVVTEAQKQLSREERQKLPRSQRNKKDYAIVTYDVDSGHQIESLALEFQGEFSSFENPRATFNVDRTKLLVIGRTAVNAFPKASVFETASGREVATTRHEEPSEFVPFGFWGSGNQLIGLRLAEGAHQYYSRTSGIQVVDPVTSSVVNDWKIGSRVGLFWLEDPCISPDQRYIAGWVEPSGQHDGYAIAILDTQSGETKAISKVQGMGREVGALAFAENSKVLLAAMSDRMHLVSVPDGSIITTKPLRGETLSDGAQNARSALYDTTSRSWLFNQKSGLLGFSRSPNKPPQPGPDLIKVVDASTVLLRVQHFPNHSEGNRTATATATKIGETLEFWDVATPSIPEPTRYGASPMDWVNNNAWPVSTVALGPDGKVFFCGLNSEADPRQVHNARHNMAAYRNTSSDRAVRLLDSRFPGNEQPWRSADAIWQLEIGGGTDWAEMARVFRSGFDAEGSVFIHLESTDSYSNAAGNIHVIDASSGETKRVLRGCEVKGISANKRFIAITVAPERAQQLAEDGSKPGLFVYDVQTNKVARQAAVGEIQDVLFSSTGKYLLARSYPGKLQLCHQGTGKLITTVEGEELSNDADHGLHQRFSANGDRLLLPVKTFKQEGFRYEETHQLKVFDCKSSQAKLDYTSEGTIWAIAASDDLRTIVFLVFKPRQSQESQNQASVMIWSDGQDEPSVLTSLRAEGEFPDEGNYSLHMTSNGSRILVSWTKRVTGRFGQEEKRYVEIWNAIERELLASTVETDGSFRGLHISEKFQTVGISYSISESQLDDAKFELRSLATGHPLKVITGTGTHNSWPVGYHGVPRPLSPDGRFLALNAKTGHRIIEMKTGHDVLVGQGHPFGNLFDGNRFFLTCTRTPAQSSNEHNVISWNLGNKQSISLPLNDKLLHAIGRLSGSDSVSRRSMIHGDGETMGQLLGMNHSGDRIFSCDANDGSKLKIWNLETGQVERELETGLDHRVLSKIGGNVRTANFSPTGDLVAVNVNGQPRLIDVATGKITASLTRTGHFGAVRKAIVSSDGQLVASAGSDRTVGIWDATSGRFVSMLEGFGSPVSNVVFSRDMTTLIARDQDGLLACWALEIVESKEKRIRPILRWQARVAPGIALALNRDGTSVATVNNTKEMEVRQVSDGAVIKSWSAPHVSHLAFHPISDNMIAAAPGHQLTMYSPDGDTLLQSALDDQQVNALAYSADGSTLVAVGSKVNVYQGSTLRHALTLDQHQGSVLDVSYAAGRFATAGEDQTVLIWDFSQVAEGLGEFGLWGRKAP